MKTKSKKEIIISLAGKDKKAQEFLEIAIDNFGGKKEVKPITIKLSINEKTREIQTDDILESFRELGKEINPQSVKTITKLEISANNHSYHKSFNTFKFRKFLGNDWVKIFQSKWANVALGIKH